MPSEDSPAQTIPAASRPAAIARASEDPGEADQYFNIPIETRARYLDLFRRYGVSHVFAGHYHRNAEARVGALEMITTGPAGKPLGGARSGMRIVKVSDAGIEHKYCDFGDLP